MSYQFDVSPKNVVYAVEDQAQRGAWQYPNLTARCTTCQARVQPHRKLPRLFVLTHRTAWTRIVFQSAYVSSIASSSESADSRQHLCSHGRPWSQEVGGYIDASTSFIVNIHRPVFLFRSINASHTHCLCLFLLQCYEAGTARTVAGVERASWWSPVSKGSSSVLRAWVLPYMAPHLVFTVLCW